MLNRKVPIFPRLFNENREFDLDSDLGGDIKNKDDFLHGTTHFLSWIWKQLEIFTSEYDLDMTLNVNNVNL